MSWTKCEKPDGPCKLEDGAEITPIATVLCDDGRRAQIADGLGLGKKMLLIYFADSNGKYMRGAFPVAIGAGHKDKELEKIYKSLQET